MGKRRLIEVATALSHSMVWPRPFAVEQERAFLASYARIFLPYRRAAFIAGALFWFMFFYWDAYFSAIHPALYTPQMLARLTWMRWLVLLVLVLCAFLSFRVHMEDELTATFLLVVALAAPTAGMMYAVFFVAPHRVAFSGYFQAFHMITIFLFTFAHIRARITCYCGVLVLLLVGMLEWWVPVFGPEAPAYLHFYAMLLVMCHGVCVKFERYARGRYQYECRLQVRNARYRQSRRELKQALRQQALIASAERDAKRLALAERELAEERARIIEEITEQKRTSAEVALRARNEALARQMVATAQAIQAQRTAEEERKRADEQTRIALTLKEQQRETAEHALANKTGFVLAAAHDIRQPLYAATNYVPCIRQAFLREDAAAAASGFEMVAGQVERAVRLTDAIMHFSQLEAPDYVLRLEPFDLLAAVNDVIDSTAGLAAQSNVRLRVHPSRHKTVIESDHTLLKRVIVNLVTNAIKYAAPGKNNRTVLIGMAHLGDCVRLDIVDNGIGIKEEDAEAIFRPFVQMHRGVIKCDPGNGLGLAFVQVIMNQLPRHRFDFTSTWGRGTWFSLYIPLTASASRTCAGAAPVPAGNDAGHLADDLAGAYVFLIEDDEAVRRSLAALLSEYGVLTEGASSLEGVDRAIEQMERVPDLLIADYRLSEVENGIDAVLRCRKYFQSDIPALLLTAEVTELPDVRRHNIAVLHKPISPCELLCQIAARVLH